MKVTLYHLHELTDSRQLMDSKPPKFLMWFIYLLLGLLLVAGTWSYFGETETQVQAQGEVRPAERGSTVKTVVAGKVAAMSVQEGATVKQGDVLVTLDLADLDKQRNDLQQDIARKQATLQLYAKLRQSIEEGVSRFNEPAGEEENLYVAQFRKYQEERNQLLAVMNSYKQVQEMRQEKLAAERAHLQHLLDWERSAEQSIIQLAKIENGQNREDLEAWHRRTQENMRREIEVAQATIGELESLASSPSDVSPQALDTLKSTALAEVTTNKQREEEQLRTLERQMRELDIARTERSLTAPTAGIVHVLKSARAGEILEAGTELFTILAVQEGKPSVQLWIENKDIAHVQAGDRIKFQLIAYPQNQYGYATGTIQKIDVDTTVDPQRGSFYRVEASLDQSELQDRKGRVVPIKIGMIGVAKITTEKKKILIHLLERFNLL